MTGPEGEGIRCAGWQEDVKAEAGGNLGEEFRSVDGFGPRLNAGESKSFCVNFKVEPDSALSNLGIKGFDPYAKVSGFSAAGAVIVCG